MATAIQLKNLLRPPNQSVSVTRATELLDSNFISFDRLLQPGGGDALNVLLQETRASLEQLNTSLDDSSSYLQDYISDAQEQTQSYLTKAQELALLRHALADELSSLSEDLLPSSSANKSQSTSLLEELESQHAKLKELENVKGYVQILQRAVILREEAIDAIKKSPPDNLITNGSVTNYKTLQTFVATVSRHCEKAQDGNAQNLKLLEVLHELSDKTWLDMKDVLSNSLITAAEQLKWPTPVNYTSEPAAARRAFEIAFVNLLRLQDLAKELHSEQPETDDGERKVGLYPLQALVRPVALRFKYHFEGNRETNRLDKPEWYFAHILNVSYDHRPFLETVLQPLLQKSNYVSVNAWREFTRLLIPIVTRKMRRSAAALAPHPSLLAHTVYQSLAFDDALRDAGFTLKGTLGTDDTVSEDVEWDGTSEVILGNKELFEAWLDGERRFADDQYNEIISSPDAWHLSDEGGVSVVNESEVQPTNAARRVKALVEQITDRYKLLPQFIHKTRFLIAVQVPVLEQFHTRISESLDAFETLSSFLVRAVPGTLTGQDSHGRDGKSMTTGVEGSRRLVKAYVSAKWMASVQTTWGEDVFFLELWHTICHKASLRKNAEEHSSLPDPNYEHDEGTIFDELIAQYLKLAERSESMLIRQVCGEIESDLRAHLYRDGDKKDRSPESDTSISQTLLPPIARLSSHLKLLHETLPRNTVANLYKVISSRLTTHILQRQVLYRGRSRMTSRDGRVVLEEANLWVEASRLALSGSVRRVDRPWARLLEAGRLLSLEGEAFTQVVTAVRLGRDDEYKKFMDELGINELSQGEVLDVLAIREDFGR